jgi:hypothetical protein
MLVTAIFTPNAWNRDSDVDQMDFLSTMETDIAVNLLMSLAVSHKKDKFGSITPEIA